MGYASVYNNRIVKMCGHNNWERMGRKAGERRRKEEGKARGRRGLR